ncbi:MAG: CoA transferase [Acidimicrobiia bacterium]|nr:CoA transferase [Acidimicrobiia bacterium]
MNVAPLDGMRVIEGSAFVAAPSGGMTLAQLGAEVVRFDQIGGGIDYTRWPRTPDGNSLYWAGLNKNKRSIAVDLRSPEARELLTELIRGAGNFLTNFPARGWMSYDELSTDGVALNMLAVTGNRDGTTALDYTVNAAIGFPFVTGPADHDQPVNNVLAAWDLICGQTAALGLLAADRHRTRTGEGSNMSLALFDVALAAVSALGHVAEAQVLGTERQRFGNDLYGAFGAMFETSDGERIYAVGISDKQWRALLEATESSDAVSDLAQAQGLDFADEGDRFTAREEIKALFSTWTKAHSLAELSVRFDELGVCWGRYQSFMELVEDDPRCSTDSELFRTVDQPGIGTYLSPGSPVAFDGLLRVDPQPAPRLGGDTEALLAELGLGTAEIGSLVDRGVVATAN